jgi:hypothetical protein
MALRIFFSYSQTDQQLRDQLDKHLAPLKRESLVETWHDRKLTPGQDFARVIDAELERAHIILLLVSADFIASEYCYGVEMKRGLERQRTGEAEVIPIILRACDWKTMPFGRLVALPEKHGHVLAWPDLDEAFTDVVQGIRRVVEKRRSAASRAGVSGAPTTVKKRKRGRTNEATPLIVETVRSSNLRITKHFNDEDKDTFLHEAFEYVASFFENSLTELAAREKAVTTRFCRVDANRFEASIYRDGKAASRCAIALAQEHHFSPGIRYATDLTSGFNESLQVETDEQALSLRTLGMFSYARREEKLTIRAGAELYWDRFIEPLQQRR